jgi:hypothetical protein
MAKSKNGPGLPAHLSLGAIVEAATELENRIRAFDGVPDSNKETVLLYLAYIKDSTSAFCRLSGVEEDPVHLVHGLRS